MENIKNDTQKGKKSSLYIRVIMIIVAFIILVSLFIAFILDRRRGGCFAWSGGSVGNSMIFSTAMRDYANDNEDMSYPSSSNHFGKYYSYRQEIDGFYYVYFINKDKSQFIFYGYAVTVISTGSFLFSGIFSLPYL